MVLAEPIPDRCRFLADITGTSPFYGVFAGPALDAARSAAMQEAASRGANAVSFAPPNMAYGATSITGRAYNCAPG